MAMALVKSKWESGNLVFRKRSDGTLVFTVAPEGVREYKTVSDIDARNGTLTAAFLASGIIVHTSEVGGGTLTFDTAPNIIAAFPGLQIGEAVKCWLINDGSQTVALAADGGATVTLADIGQEIAANESCLLLIHMTAAATVTVYTVGA